MDRPPSGIDFASPVDLPDISTEQSFFDIVKVLAKYISGLIVVPISFEDLRVGQGHLLLEPITEHLGENCQQPEIVAALLALKWHYELVPDDRGIVQTRSWACEIIAWRYLSYLSEYDLLDYLLYEVKPRRSNRSRPSPWFRSGSVSRENTAEASPLLERQPSATQLQDNDTDDENDPTARFAGLNALEIAAVAEAKKFLAQRSVQRIVGAIWRGEVIFWPALSVATTKKPQRYNPRQADPYSRLRVPRYQKLFEALFFASFLGLYYAVLLERHSERITPLEILLYVWIAAFAYDEFGELRDSGSLFYTADVWNLWDAAIVLVALVFLIVRSIGLAQGDAVLLDVSFDILSLEALLLVPRLSSILSIHPYFGTLIPCLKEMTKDFVKFLAVVVILYLGFLTTFAMLARDQFTVKYISWILVYVFFGSSYIGFDIATKISPMLGPPLMIVFVALTNILLLTSLISLLSNSLAKVLEHAREEYLFQYSLFVLEASASRRLTYYLPPLNLIPLVLFRPLRPFIHADTLRQLRITTLKATHWPFVLLIWLYETAPGPRQLFYQLFGRDSDDQDQGTTGTLFSPPRTRHQYSNRSPSNGLNGKHSNTNKWQLDLQPRVTHGRNFSQGHGLSLAANKGGGGSMRDIRRQQDIRAALQRQDTADKKSMEVLQAQVPAQAQVSPQDQTTAQDLVTTQAPVSTKDRASSGSASPVLKQTKGVSIEDFRSLKETISSLEALVKQLVAEKNESPAIAVSNTILKEDEG